jgi:DNA-binding transcriptional ArsR family regulator
MLHGTGGKRMQGENAMATAKSASPKAVNRFESTLGAVVAHPVRVAAYVILNERVASPVDIATVIGEPLTTVGYHVRKLQELDVIELVEERPVRGAVEHRYAAKKRPIAGDEDWARLSDAQRDAMTKLTLQLIVANAAHAVNAGTFDSRLNRCLVRQVLQVDEQGFAELHDLDERRYLETVEIEARSMERRAADASLTTVSTETFAGFYERPSHPPEPS